MATWRFFGWTGGGVAASTAVANASAVALGDGDGVDLDSGLSFGGGTRADFQSNISINNWNTSMHWAKSTAESGNADYCGSGGSHLWPIKPTALNFVTPDSAASCILNEVNIVMAAGTPHANKGIGARFTHDFPVKCSPVQIWAATAGSNYCSGVTNPLGCYVAIVDLTSSVPEWSTTRPGAKLLLKAHGSEAEEHWWSVGIAVAPLVVGHIGENCVKIECTYF